MAKITHLLDGVDRGEPRNWQDLEITVDWLNKKESGAVNVSDLAFTGEANEYIQNRMQDGTNGGLGIFEGIPYDMVVGDINNPGFRFKGYLDMTENNNVIGGEEVISSLKKLEGDDWLNEKADAFSMAYLYDIGIIRPSDSVKVPYVINYVPDNMQLIVLAMSIFMITKEIIEDINKITDQIADAGKSVTPLPVVVVTPAGPGYGLAFDVAYATMTILKIIGSILYRIAMLIALKNLIQELFEQLLPKKRYHTGMTFERIFQRSCEYLNLQFSSHLLQVEKKDFVYIPPKSEKGGDRSDTFFPGNTSAIYTFGDAIRVLKEKYNADYRIRNGVFYFERKDKFRVTSTYRLPKTFSNQERRLDQYSFNTSEMVSNYNILYDYDVQDQNTLENQDGRVFQAITTPRVINNPKLVNIKNLAQITIPFSMGLEKRKLTDVEKVFKTMGRLIDNITSIFGSGTNYASKIEDRIGSLLISSHYLSIGKVVVMKGDKLANDQRALLDTLKLWNDFHFINSFAKYNGVHNQYKRFAEPPVLVPMELSEFVINLENNIAEDADGNEIEIEEVKYKPNAGTALVKYRIKHLYTDNLQIKIIQ